RAGVAGRDVDPGIQPVAVESGTATCRALDPALSGTTRSRGPVVMGRSPITVRNWSGARVRAGSSHGYPRVSTQVLSRIVEPEKEGLPSVDFLHLGEVDRGGSGDRVGVDRHVVDRVEPSVL